MATTAGDAGRIAHLDGLRGVAAVMVLFAHMLNSLLPSLVVFWPKVPHAPLETAVGTSPLALLWAGKFAVCIFFVLSGYVLSGFCLHTRLSFPAQVARRYLRLVPPMLVVSFLSWLLLRFGLYRNNLAAHRVTNSAWLSWWYNFQPDFLAMVRETLYGTFVSGKSEYNSNLWTMKIELIGSVGIFLLYRLVRNRNLRLVFLAMALLPGRGDYYPLFAAGALLMELSGSMTGLLSRAVPRPAWREGLAGGVFVAGMYLGSVLDPPLSPVFRWHYWLSVFHLKSQSWQMLGAVVALAGLQQSFLLQKMFGSRAGVFLGRISFMLYLVHIPVLCSLTAWVALGLRGQPYPVIVLGAGTATIAAVLALSMGLTRWVEQYTTAFSRMAGRAIDHRFPAEPRP